MNESQVTYRQIIQAASIFGGVQVLQIAIAVVRCKVIVLFVAHLIRIFTKRSGNLFDTDYYTAGFTLINTCYREGRNDRFNFIETEK